MSSQKSPNSQKMGISLQMIQKPTLKKCDSASCTDCYIEHPVKKYPRGFYCPSPNKSKTKNISAIPSLERETFEDHYSF